jgi:ABC-type dipeptide/oligopeptide/nickel transport system permease component/ABC-type transport system substrate-binding protein
MSEQEKNFNEVKGSTPSSTLPSSSCPRSPLPAPSLLSYLAKSAGKIFASLVCLLAVMYLCGLGLRKGVTANPSDAIIDPAVKAEYDKLRSPVIDPRNPPEILVDVDYSAGKNASWYPKGESPILKKLVDEGKLPSVEERVGPEPAVYRGFAGIGKYGGDWWRLAEDIDSVRLCLQYELNDNTLLRFSPYRDPVKPHLAREVVPSDNFKVWTVHLRKGVKWSDGVPFTSEDICWWWKNVQKDEDVGYVPETMKVNGKSGEIEKVDDYTLRYVFPEPNPGWLYMQASAAGALFMPAPKHYMEQFHPKSGNKELITKLTRAQMITPKQLFADMKHPLNPECPKLSPWIFKTYSSNGPWTAVRNPYYFAVDEEGNQLPYMDRLVFRQISGLLQSKAVTDGMISFGGNIAGVDYSSLMSMRKNGDYQVRHWASGQAGSMCLVPNRYLPVDPGDRTSAERARLLADKEFRRALSISIDRQQIVQIEFKGVGLPSSLGPGPSSLWYDPEHLKANAQHDPAEANRILDSLGLSKRDSEGYRVLPDGSSLALTLITRAGVAGALQFVVDDWKDVGLRVLIREKPHRLFIISMKYADIAMTGDAGDSSASWEALGAGGPFWDWYYNGGMHGDPAAKSPEITQPGEIELEAMRLGQKAANTLDKEEKSRCARQVMRLARENIWAITISTPMPAPFIVKNGLMGVPELLMSDFMLNTPNNGLPEAWYWENPDMVNGDQKASPQYAADREIQILDELQNAVPKPSSGPAVAAPENRGSSFSKSVGMIIRMSAIGIAALLVILFTMRNPFVLKRLLIMIPTLGLISVIVYTGVQLPPGSYLNTVIENLEKQGMKEQAKKEIEELTRMYHLEDGDVKNYFRWSGLLWFTTFKGEDKGVLQGNLGRSMSNNGAFVTDIIGDRLLLTMCIAFGTMILTWIIAIPIGVYSAVRQYSIADYVLTIGGFIGMCVPSFILALVLMLLAKEICGITVMGLFSSQYAMQPYWDLPKVVDLLKHIWLPILIVGAGGTAGMIRFMRANLLDELRKPYVTTAKAKGVRPVRLLFKYPFRLALNPFISGIGHIFPGLVSGAAIVDIILSLPTTGPLLLNAVMLEDTYMAGSLLLCLSALSVFGILVSDLLLMLVDPRIRMGGGSR